MPRKNGKACGYLQRGRKKRNMLSFRLEFAKELIGSFSSRQRVGGRPRSAEHLLLNGLNSNLGIGLYMLAKRAIVMFVWLLLEAKVY